jgi:bifunctional aspartokinase / homoserine dehydrogenase 1
MENSNWGRAAFGERDGLHPRSHDSSFELSSSVARRGEILREDVFHSTSECLRLDRPGKRPLRIMKFGGTSLGDASCIEKVVEIIRDASKEWDVVVVVSAMSGVTNKLIEAATQSEAGNREPVAVILENLRKQHEAAATALVHLTSERRRLGERMQVIFDEGDYLCQGTILLRELTPRALDSISSLGERLSAPLVAAALAGQGVVSEAIEATELFVTDACHGAAEPRIALTRERCQARLGPLLLRGVVPVLTGFIGATDEGVLTTLGRGGSDYSATILGSALDADEVIIWTDVDGVLTADPRLVHSARTIPEISYREAAELANFGAKVLHPKTLRPVMQSEITIWIRNTFAPELSGTKITAAGPPNGGGVKALTAISDVALITVGGPGIMGMRDVLGRTFTTTAAVRADILLISQSSSQNDICFIVPLAVAKCTVEALRREFAQDLAHEKVEHITLDTTIAIVAVVGEKMRGTPGIVARTLVALGREGINISAIVQGSSECNISVVVAQKDMKSALLAVHREFQLGAATSEAVRGASSTVDQPEFSLPHAQATEPELAQGMD